MDTNTFPLIHNEFLNLKSLISEPETFGCKLLYLPLIWI